MLATLIHLIFYTYSIVLFFRILGGWIPQLQKNNFHRFACFLTEPYLKIFRKMIPPTRIGIDLSPIPAVLLLEITEHLLLRFFG